MYNNGQNGGSTVSPVFGSTGAYQLNGQNMGNPYNAGQAGQGVQQAQFPGGPLQGPMPGVQMNAVQGQPQAQAQNPDQFPFAPMMGAAGAQVQSPQQFLQNSQGPAELTATQSMQFGSPWAERALTTNAGHAQMRQHSGLPEGAWTNISDTVMQAIDDQLVIFNDIRSLGLIDTSYSIYDKDTTWYLKDNAASARISMTPDTRTEANSTSYELDGAPLPFVHSGFEIGFRDRPSPNSPHNPNINIETDGADAAGRAVSETIETLMLTGWMANFGSRGYNAYGLLNHPDVNTGTLSNWGGDTPTIRNDFRTVIRHIRDNNIAIGNNGLRAYLSTDLYDHLDDTDPEVDDGTLVRERTEQLSGLGQIRESEYLPAGSLLAFVPSAETFEVGMAADVQTVQWDPNPWVNKFKVMSCLTPMVKSTSRGQCGVAYYSV